jgi:hypothetical protein
MVAQEVIKNHNTASNAHMQFPMNRRGVTLSRCVPHGIKKLSVLRLKYADREGWGDE